MADAMLIEYAKRLGVYDEKEIEKASELHRRIKMIKSFNENDQVKIVLSIDCGAALYGHQCDIEELMKRSGLKRNDYSNKRQRFEQSLNLAKKITLNEICAMLELNETVQLDAEYLLNEYKRKMFLNDDDSVALLMAMALFQTCKSRGVKISKSKLLSLKGMESLKSRWKKVEEEWNQWMEKETPFAKRAKPKSAKSPPTEESSENDSPNVATAKPATNTIQRVEEKTVSYEEWRDAMIKRAESELKKMQQNSK